MVPKKQTSEDSLLIQSLEDPIGSQMLQHFENQVLDKFVSLEKSMTLQLGCSTKAFSLGLMEKLGSWSRLIIIEPSKPLLESTRLHVGSKATGKAFFKSDMNWAKLPFDDGVFQSIVSVLFWDRSPNRFRMFEEMSRVLALSGIALLVAYLKDSARELFDLYSEVITQYDMQHLMQPLQTVRNMFLSKSDYKVLAEECGFTISKIHDYTYKMEYENSKELFASPLFQSQWLPLFEKIAGKESDRVFWHIRQTMDRYYSGRKVPLTMVGGLIVAIK